MATSSHVISVFVYDSTAVTDCKAVQVFLLATAISPK